MRETELSVSFWVIFRTDCLAAGMTLVKKTSIWTFMSLKRRNPGVNNHFDGSVSLHVSFTLHGLTLISHKLDLTKMFFFHLGLNQTSENSKLHFSEFLNVQSDFMWVKSNLM